MSKVNHKTVRKIADQIEWDYKHPAVAKQRFNLETWFTDESAQMGYHRIFKPAGKPNPECGTVLCVAGYTAHVHTNIHNLSVHGEIFGYATKKLGLGRAQAELLFTMRGRDEETFKNYYENDRELGDIHPMIAVHTLRHLADTGKVSWDVGKKRKLAADRRAKLAKDKRKALAKIAKEHEAALTTKVEKRVALRA